MAYDGQYVGKRALIACKKELGGLIICHLDGKCSGCSRAEKYEEEHSEEVRL